MPVADPRLLAGGSQPLGGVLPHGLEQSVPGDVAVRLGEHERRVDEPTESIEGPRLAEIFGAHPLDRLQRERSGEHSQPSEEHPLVVGEQVMAPGQGGRQCLLTGDRCPAPAAEQRERVAEARGDLLRRKHRDTRRSELQRQRHTVEAITDLRHRSGVVVGEREPGRSRRGTQDEQLQRGDASHRLCRGDVLRIGHGERRRQPADLTRDAQRLPAGRQDGDLRTALQQLARPSEHTRRSGVHSCRAR